MSIGDAGCINCWILLLLCDGTVELLEEVEELDKLLLSDEARETLLPLLFPPFELLFCENEWITLHPEPVRTFGAELLREESGIAGLMNLSLVRRPWKDFLIEIRYFLKY